jgi:5-amino-6-(5-phosphoribosylamino)uracil reductase
VLAGRRALDPAARVFDGGGTVVLRLADVAAVLDDLAARGVRRLLVEGGTAVHTAFLAAGAVDELHLALAPLLVGDGPAVRAPRGVPRRSAGGWSTRARTATPWCPGTGDERRAAAAPAIALAGRCPPSATFRVGAVVTDAAAGCWRGVVGPRPRRRPRRGVRAARPRR